MFVIKKNGKKETLNVEKIYKRIEKMTPGINVDESLLRWFSEEVLARCYEDIPTREVDKILLQVLEGNLDKNKQIEVLAARVAVSNLHRDTRRKFSSSMKLLHDNNRLSDEEYDIVQEHKTFFDSCIVGDRDFNFDLNTFKEISKELEIVGDKTAERVQHYILRQSLHNWKSDVNHVVEDYHRISCDKNLLLSCIVSNV